MKARMDKYDSSGTVTKRTQKNQNLYDDLSDHINIDYVDIDVSNAIELDSKDMNLTTRENYKKKREFEGLINNHQEKEYEEEPEVKLEENKIYDINEILKLARQDKLFEDENKKRLLNTEYNILTKLDIDDIEGEDIKKEDLKSLINDIYEQELPKKVKKYTRKEEDDLFNDLIASDSKDTIREEIKLKEELSKEILDKETKEIPKKEDIKEEKTDPIATKIDTTSFENIFDNKEEEEETEGKGLIIAIIIVTVLILLTIAFFVADYFFAII